MPITNFSSRSGSGSSRAPDLFRPTQNRFDYDTPRLFRYPIDLGSTSKEHYMVIHVNRQEKTVFQPTGGLTDSPDLPTIAENRRLPGFSGSNVYNSIFIPGSEWLANLPVVKQFTSSVGLPSGSLRTIVRTTDTIALYMPDTLNFAYNQHYSELELTGGLTALASMGSSLYDSLKGKGVTNITGSQILQTLGRNVSPFALNYLAQRSGSNLNRVLFGGFFGFVQNPQIELLYTSPRMREFSFEFMFYPRSEVEALEVQRILSLLRFHQAPELVQEFNGFFITPPSEFDIKFYYNGFENPNIPKISTCVLHSINVDYAPHGFAAYETQTNRRDAELGKTGMPFAIRLTLGFKEKEILTKAHFAGDADYAPFPPDYNNPN